MTVQDNIDFQKLVEPQILKAIQDGPVSVQDLCARIDAPDYIIKRGFWSLVDRGQAYLNDDYDAAIV
jgi:hypothetical protein